MPSSIGSKLPIILLASSVVLNVAQTRKIANLENTIEKVTSKGSLKPGTLVRPIRGRSPDGTPRVLSYGDVAVPTVLYVFTPQCGWCQKNVDNLRALLSDTGVRFRLVGISLTNRDLADYLSRESLSSLPVLTDLDTTTILDYELGGTPTTIVVSPQGVVLKVWTGVYSDFNKRDIQDYLHVALPGCCKSTT